MGKNAGDYSTEINFHNHVVMYKEYKSNLNPSED